MPALLSSIDQIDPAWLQSVFRAAGKEIPDINSVHLEPLGHGNTGVTVKAVIEYDANGSMESAPASVVCKLHPPDPERLEHARSNGVFSNRSQRVEVVG